VTGGARSIASLAISFVIRHRRLGGGLIPGSQHASMLVNLQLADLCCITYSIYQRLGCDNY